MIFEDIKGPGDIVTWLREHTEGDVELLKAMETYERLLPTMSEALPLDVDTYTMFASGQIEDEKGVVHNAYAMCRSLTEMAVVGDCHAITFITDAVSGMIVDITYHSPGTGDDPVAGEYEKMDRAKGVIHHEPYRH